MLKTKTLTSTKIFTVSAIQFITLLAAATLVPLFHQQAITGTIVNALLFISVVILGSQSAILIGLIPSVIALAVGLLSPILAPMVPFIMIGNTILVLTFSYLKKRNYWLAVISASFLKFLFLFAVSSVVISLVLKEEIARNIAIMMSWPQLFTALAGGLIAYFFLKVLKK